jgi:hypothetical protein
LPPFPETTEDFGDAKNAWMVNSRVRDLDAMAVQPLSQRYTRVSRNTYRYESNTGFSAEIAVDDLGLLTAYPGGWERIGSL